MFYLIPIAYFKNFTVIKLISVCLFVQIELAEPRNDCEIRMKVNDEISNEYIVSAWKPFPRITSEFVELCHLYKHPGGELKVELKTDCKADISFDNVSIGIKDI